MTYLADVNFWLALSIAEHVHHESANRFLDNLLRVSVDNKITFCRVTQLGFLRLLTQPNVMKTSVLTPKRAWEFFDKLLEGDGIGYIDEPRGIELSWRETTSRQLFGNANNWTDHYLAAFAAAGGYTLVTFDKALAARGGCQITLLA